MRHLFFIFLIASTLSPGGYAQAYFQQEVNYRISVTLDDERHELHAFESLDYINNSPDTLRFLYFHLWPNAYSDNSTSLAQQLINTGGKRALFNDPELQGYIDSLDFMVDEKEVKWTLIPGTPDICRIELDNPITQGDTVTITTPFHVKIPKGVSSRLGHYGQSYQISQWFPKPAVYDNSGWHQMSYLDQGEFYSEFGSFEVSVTLPENYIVGATGDLQDESEKKMLSSLAADTTWRNRVQYGEADFPPSSRHLKTVRYTASKIHDFAWFADKRFNVMEGAVKLPDSGREVTTWVMFTDRQAVLWKDALEYVNNAVRYFSGLIGDYPYNSFTAVQSALSAGAGMEYPGITVIGLADDAYSLDEVIAHETCHSWFYSALASDERRYPYLDEGIVSAYTSRYMTKRYPGSKLWDIYIKNRKMAAFFHLDQLPVERMGEIEWLLQARSNMEQPANLPATEYTTLNYNIMIYTKAAISFNYLRAYLGDSLFDASMKEYYRKWSSQHPGPDDLRAAFETTSDKDLAWFFSDLLGTVKRLDYQIKSEDNGQLLVKNRGELASPLIITGMNGDSVIFENWTDGFTGTRLIRLPAGNYTEIKLDPTHVMPELFRLNNNIRTSGIFRKCDPVQTQLLLSLIEDPDKRALIYIPTVNWNRENGFMAGVALHNGFIMPKPVEYLIMPFYGFKNSDLGGYGRISLNIAPYDNLIRMVSFTLEGSRFGSPGDQNYHKAKVGFTMFFRPVKMTSSLTHNIFANYIAASDLSQIMQAEKAKMNSYLQYGYLLKKTGMINPFSLTAILESGKLFRKTAVEFDYRLSYYGRNNGLDIRLFTGAMLKSASEVPFYSLAAGGRSGGEQYLYGGTYPDRFSIFPQTQWSRQMTLDEGGLVSPVNDSLGYSNWLISLSFTSNLPGKAGNLPVKPFVSLMMNDHGLSGDHESPFFYEAGLKAGIWDFFEIYLPLVVSGNIRSICGPLKDRIRFVFSLDAFNRAKMKTGTSN